MDAVIELFAEGSFEPALSEVAERSGVSRRSVYRYFVDTDSLTRAAIARHLERTNFLFQLEQPGIGALVGRIDRTIAARLRLYEVIAPAVRAALVMAPRNEVIREHLDLRLREIRRQVDEMFAPELDGMSAAAGREVSAALDLLLGFQSIEHLRRVRGFSGPECRRVLTRAASSLLSSET